MAPGNQNPMAGLMNAGPPIFDNDQMNQLLQPYGVQMPSQYQQPGPFENMPGFAGKHPGLSRGLDNALIAVANMGPTGRTAGENISNAARGVLSVGPYRRQFAAEQAQMPFAFAKEIGGLQQQQAMIDELRGRGQYYRDVGNQRAGLNEANLMRTQMQMNMRGATGHDSLQPGPNGFAQRPEIDKDNNLTYVDTEIKNEDLMQERNHAKAVQRFGGGLAAGVLVANLKAAGYDPNGDIPSDVLNAQYAKVNALGPGPLAQRDRDVNPSANDKLNQAVGTNKTVLQGFLKPFDIKNPEAELKAETQRRMQLYLSDPKLSGSMSEQQLRTQAEAQAKAAIQEKQAAYNRVTGAYAEYSSTHDLQGMQGEPFSMWMLNRGFDPQTGNFVNQRPQGGQTPTPQAQQPQLSPFQQALVGALK